MTAQLWSLAQMRAQAEPRSTAMDALAFASGVLLVLIYSQGWLGPVMGYGAATQEGPLIRLIYFPAYAAGLFLVLTALPRTIEGLVQSPLLLVLLGLVAVSWFWSVDPSATVRRFVALGFTSLGGVALAARFRWPTFAELVATAFAVLAVLSVLMALAKPEWGLMTREFPGAWRGLWLEKNNLGGNMTVGFGFCVAAAVLAPQRRKMWAAFALLCVLLVAASTSKTSLVVLLLTVGCMGFVWLVHRGPAAGVSAAWAGLVGLFLIAAIWLFAADAVFDFLGKDATLTGRTEIWDGINRVMVGHAWTGYGYGAIWDDTDAFAPLAWITHYAGFRANHAHNGWMEIWLNIGLIGVIAFGLWFIETWMRTLWATFSGDAGAWVALPFVAAYSIAMLTESITLNWHDMRWVLFVAVAVKLALGDPQPARWVRFNSAMP